jgi:hypothetical protein
MQYTVLYLGDILTTQLTLADQLTIQDDDIQVNNIWDDIPDDKQNNIWYVNLDASCIW